MSTPFPTSAVRRPLLAWFDRHARDLPWRTDRDPYRIWISEVMLQQTTVAAVIPYFHRFLARFPTLADLAAAEPSDVLRLWEGLGYYSRARNLHAAARLIVGRHQGELPRDEDAVRQLPGFGRYTANAVLSQAYDVRLPILEANSVRLLCRLAAIDDDPKDPATLKKLWALAGDLVPDRRPGDFNQALMELGALVCTPSDPRCGECPLTSLCHSHALGRVHEIPRKVARAKPTLVRETAVVLWRENKVFLAQRPSTGRWADLWEFPRTEVAAGQSPDAAAVALMKDLGFTIAEPAELTTIRHGVTRFRITLVCLEARSLKGEFRPGLYPRGEWLSPAELSDHPVSRPQRRLATMIQQPREPRLF